MVTRVNDTVAESQLLRCAARRVHVGEERQTARAQGSTVAVRLVASAVVFLQAAFARNARSDEIYASDAGIAHPMHCLTSIDISTKVILDGFETKRVTG